MRTRAAMVLVATAVWSVLVAIQPGLGLDLPAAAAVGVDGDMAPASVAGGVAWQANAARGIGAQLSEASRAKFVEPAEDAVVVESEYLVTFAAEASPAVINAAARRIRQADADVEIKALGNRRTGWKGVGFRVPPTFTLEQTAALLTSLLALPQTQFAEPNLVVTKSCPSITTPATVTTNAVASGANLWGLDRIDQVSLPLNRVYGYGSGGASDVNVFVADTGVKAGHTEFGGRVSFGFDAFGVDADDVNGHGTHCAGTIGGATVGVARNVKIVAVKVLNNDGSGSIMTVVNGINYVIGSTSTPKRILSMSLGGGASSTIDDAVARASAAGVLVVVAAGNDGRDACRYSPARAPSAITVAASTSSDTLTSWSNRGSCVDIIAPGSGIFSAYPPSGATNGYASLSGTSMACPHVAGVAARLWGANACSSAADCANALLCMASANRFASLPRGTPNRLLYAPPGL